MSSGRRLHSRRRWMLGCLGASALAFVAFTVACETSEPDSLFFSWHESPLRWIDPSAGATDERLADELARALLLPPIGEWSTSHSPQLPYGVGAFNDSADFEARVNTVPGWDAIITISPYGDCERAARDPSISSWWLRRRLQHTNGFLSDGIYVVLAVRNGAMVAEVLAYSGVGRWAAPGTGHLKDVIVRSP